MYNHRPFFAGRLSIRGCKRPLEKGLMHWQQIFVTASTLVMVGVNFRLKVLINHVAAAQYLWAAMQYIESKINTTWIITAG